jgi:hypothetical protein
MARYLVLLATILACGPSYAQSRPAHERDLSGEWVGGFTTAFLKGITSRQDGGFGQSLSIRISFGANKSYEVQMLGFSSQGHYQYGRRKIMLQQPVLSTDRQSTPDNRMTCYFVGRTLLADVYLESHHVRVPLRREKRSTSSVTTEEADLVGSWRSLADAGSKESQPPLVLRLYSDNTFILTCVVDIKGKWRSLDGVVALYFDAPFKTGGAKVSEAELAISEDQDSLTALDDGDETAESFSLRRVGSKPAKRTPTPTIPFAPQIPFDPA